MSIKSNKLIVILGPTSSGKSDLAVRIAREFNGEIISADSRQVYKGMDIGSGKITKKEMQNIPHHLLDVASPKKRFTVAQFQKLAFKAIEKIQRKNKIPVLCGGTGLYIQSIVDGLVFPEVPPDAKLRAKLEKLKTEKLFIKLQKLDPRRAKNIDCRNRRRLIRALEIIIKTGKPVSSVTSTPYSVIPALCPSKAFSDGGEAGIQNIGKNKRVHLDPRFHGDNTKINFLQLGIGQPKEKLKKLIKKRLLKRLKQGMVAEVMRLRKQGVSWKRLEEFGLEYRAVAQYLQKKTLRPALRQMLRQGEQAQGKLFRQEMINKIQKESEQYAKRQMTWFKRDKRIRWVKNYKKAIKLVKIFTNKKRQ